MLVLSFGHGHLEQVVFNKQVYHLWVFIHCIAGYDLEYNVEEKECGFTKQFVCKVE